MRERREAKSGCTSLEKFKSPAGGRRERSARESLFDLESELASRTKNGGER